MFTNFEVLAVPCPDFDGYIDTVLTCCDPQVGNSTLREGCIPPYYMVANTAGDACPIPYKQGACCNTIDYNDGEAVECDVAQVLYDTTCPQT